MLEILRHDCMPDGTDIQLENWNGKLGIGAYPKAKINGNFGIFANPRKGEPFRLSITSNWNGDDSVMRHYELLIKGELTLLDLEPHWYFGIVNGDYENFKECVG